MGFFLLVLYSIAALRVHQLSVCMMSSRAGDRTAGDLRARLWLLERRCPTAISADIEIRECFARQENDSAVVSFASCVHFREKLMFLLLQLLLMVMLVVMTMVGSMTIWSADRQIRRLPVHRLHKTACSFRKLVRMLQRLNSSLSSVHCLVSR